MEKYIKDGLVGVLVSPGYGAGWSSWNLGNKEFLLMDKKLVELQLEGAEESIVKDYCKESLGEDIYMGGWEDVEVVWVGEGTKFMVTEYAGYEKLLDGSSLDIGA